MVNFIKNTLSSTKFLKVIFVVFLIFLPLNIFSQISYTTDCGTTTGWSFVNLSKTYYASAGCSGGGNNYSFADNLWSVTGDGSMSRSFSSSNGNEVTLTFDFSAHDYSSSTATSTSDYDVHLQYSTDNSSWTTVATMSKSSSSSCQSKTMTHTPTSGTIYYKILVDWISGDFDVEIDNISFTQASGPSISYSSATFCSGDSDPSPTLTNNAGSGTYSSSAGLSINSSTGVIDISASTQGAYTVTYTDTDAQTATFNVTINSNTIYVNDNSTSGDIYASAAFDGSGDGSISDPYNTLTDAIAAATCPSTTTIYVDAGTYTEENISISDGTDDILIQGAGNSLTIFDGDNTDDWITFASGGNTDNITITDITVKQYGGTASQDGGAMRILGGTNIVFEDVIFTENETDGATNWGAVAFIDYSADAKFDRCTFHNNTTSGRGSVFYDASNGTLEMYNCLVYENDAGSYGDIIIADASSSGGTHTISNCTFTDNLAQSTGMGASGEVFSIWEGTTTFNNCIFYNNASTYDVAENYETVTLNYCMFDAELNRSSVKNNTVSGTPTFTDSSNDDYSLTETSDGVDDGSATYAPALDILEVSRPQGLADDIGCFEYAPNNWTGSISTAWTNAGNWSLGSVPTSSESVTIPNVTNQPVITSSATLTGLTIDSGADITVSSNSLTVTGTFDLNGTMNIDNATVNVDGTFDATGGTIDFTNTNGKLILSSTVTSLGTLDALMGTVEYDGSTQTVFGDNYYNLEIDASGTKSAGGAINVDGNLTTSATAGCKLDMGAYALNLAGNLTVGATDGLDLSDAASLVTFDGSIDQTLTHAGNNTGSLGATQSEGFETGSGSWTVDNSGSFDWERKTGSTGSSGTGPSGAYAGSYYYYTEATYGSTGDDDYITQTFNFSSYASPQLTFYYHMYGSDMGTLYVEANTGGGWSVLETISGQQHGSTGASWTLSTVDLSAYAGNSSTQIRFHGERGSGYTSDMAIDAVEISDAGPAPNGSEFNDLTINNSGGNVIFNDEISVDGTITFTSGDIDASSNNLVLTSNASVSGADDDSHVIGTIVKTIASDASHEFPLGNGTVLRKVDIDPNDATSRDWTVTYTNNVYSDVTTTGLLTYVSDTCYWDITPTSTPASTTVKLNWSSAIGINDADLTNIKLAHYNGTDWELISTTTSGVPLAGSVSGNVTSFSPFTIGTTGANPLPVTLTQFEGYAYNEFDNKLEWTTKTEKNADYMEIQHSDDGIYFDVIGIEKLAGNSQSELFYEFIDRSVSRQINYYRLKQFDFDGKSTLTKTISIDNRSSDTKQILRITNLIGQEIDKNYKGVVIIQYSDGSSEKRIQ